MNGDETEKALVVTDIVRPLVTAEQALRAWEEYQALVNALCTEEDYQAIGGKKFRKKSGWRKLARAFNLADRIVCSNIDRDDLGRPLFAGITVEAAAPNGRTATGYHEAHLTERCCPSAYGKSCDHNHAHCANGCDGWVHWSHPGDIPATAHTRAKNRAIADLIGAGEVSAEEMESKTEATSRRAPKSQAQAPGWHRPPPPTVKGETPTDLARRGFYARTKELGLTTQEAVHKALGLQCHPSKLHDTPVNDPNSCKALSDTIKQAVERGQDQAAAWTVATNTLRAEEMAPVGEKEQEEEISE